MPTVTLPMERKQLSMKTSSTRKRVSFLLPPKSPMKVDYHKDTPLTLDTILKARALFRKKAAAEDPKPCDTTRCLNDTVRRQLHCVGPLPQLSPGAFPSSQREAVRGWSLGRPAPVTVVNAGYEISFPHCHNRKPQRADDLLVRGTPLMQSSCLETSLDKLPSRRSSRYRKIGIHYTLSREEMVRNMLLASQLHKFCPTTRPWQQQQQQQQLHQSRGETCEPRSGPRVHSGHRSMKLSQAARAAATLHNKQGLRTWNPQMSQQIFYGHPASASIVKTSVFSS